jgi:hypothetical protein
MCVVLGVGALSGAGRAIGSTNYIDPEQFHRFHLYINPQTLYYPTASQIVNLARASIRRDQVAVIVGGSSAMWGFAQSDEELWSRKLQSDLGDGYRVINLGMPSGSPQEYAGITAQALLKDGYQVVLVPDLGSTFGPPDGLFYPYVYWDAFYKGYLLNNPRGSERIQEVSGARPVGSRAPLDELELQGLLGSWLYFTDLWNAFSYKVAFTVWNFLVYPPTAQFYTPRGTLRDPQAHYPDESRHSSPPFNTAMEIVRAYVYTQCPVALTGPDSPDATAAYWQNFTVEADAVFPEEFRPHVLVVRLFQSRLYRDALSAQEDGCYIQAFGRASSTLRALGYQATEIGQDWSVDDYIDVTHPSPQGGARMAQQIATLVQQMSAQLGYSTKSRGQAT